MLQVEEIERMNPAERVEAMERLWIVMSRDASEVSSPSWHGPVLSDRLAKIEAGEARFLTLEQAKARLQAG